MGGWIFDDWPLIADNRYVHAFSWYPRWLSHDFWDVDTATAQLLERRPYWRPLVTASYALDWNLSGGSPPMFHATNLALHAAVGALCFFTLRRWSNSSIGALLGALIFVLHPTKAESVAWISGRPDVLMTLFVLAASAGIALRLRGKRSGIVLELVATLLAYASKEHAVVLPLFAAIEVWVAAGRPPLGKQLLALAPRALRTVAPQAAAAIVYLTLRNVWLPMRSVEVRGLTAAKQTGFVLETIGRYAELVVFPSDLALASSTIRVTSEGPVVSSGLALIGALTLVVLVACGLAFRRRSPAVAMGAVLFAGALLPVSNVIWPASATLTSPRFLYLPLLGAALVVAHVVAMPRWGLWAKSVAAVCAVLVAWTSIVRSQDFASSDAFWAYELRKAPDAPIVLRIAVDRELREQRPRRALKLASCAHAAATKWFTHSGAAGDFVLWGARALAVITPDAERASLERLARFLDDIASGKEASLQTPGLSLRLAADSKAAARLRRLSPQVRILQAEILSRMDDDKAALSTAGLAVSECMRCAPVVADAALIAARAGDSELADSYLERAAKLGAPIGRLRDRIGAAYQFETYEFFQMPVLAAEAMLVAQRHARLGAWGRAHAALAPYHWEIQKGGHQAAIAAAEVAFRAGETGSAEELLRAVGLGAGAPEAFAAWRRQMGWEDAPANGEEPLVPCPR